MNRAHLAALLLAASLALLSSPACSVKLTSGGDAGSSPPSSPPSSTPPDTPPPDPPSAPTTTCFACLHDPCAAEEALCDADGECRAIYDCAVAPGCDQSCGDACYTAHPAGQRDYDALAWCDARAGCGVCASACAGWITTCAPYDGGAVGCSECAAGACPAQAAACGDGTDCAAWMQCQSACTDATCAAQCDAAHAQGKSDGDAYSTCASASCAGPCGGG